MDDPSADPYGGDPLLRDCVERALEPHRSRLSAERIDAMRDYLIVFLTTHPAAEPLYARLRSRPPAERSALVDRAREARAPAKQTDRGGEEGTAVAPKLARRA